MLLRDRCTLKQSKSGNVSIYFVMVDTIKYLLQQETIMEPTQLIEQHERNGTKAHNGKQVSATSAERVLLLPDAPDTLWQSGKERWQVQGAAMIAAGVLTIRDLPVLEDHCHLYQQRLAWSLAIEDKVSRNGGRMPLNDEQIDKAALNMAKLNKPYNQTCEFLGIGALSRAKRGNAATKNGTAGGVQRRTGGIPTRRRG